MATNLTPQLILRQRAEVLVKSRKSKSGSQISEADLFKLIHELEVHQIEIEMQNEELMLSRSAAIDSADKYIELYNFAPVGYFTLSREGKIIDVNLCGSQMLEKERSFLENRQFISFISGDTKPAFNFFIKGVFNSNLKKSCEVSLLKNDNLPNYVQLTGFVAGNGEQCLVNAIDITAQRQAETEIKLKNDELGKLNVEKDKLFSVLAHDLRSPLSSLLNLTEILTEELNKMKKEEMLEIANLLIESATRVFLLIENLLQWAKMQLGLIELKVESARLIDVINKSIKSLSDNVNQKNQEIQVQVPENIFVKADLTMLESILRNLISNAIKFSFQRGKILISAKTVHENFVETSIQDDGLGMSSALLKKLFHIGEQTGRNGTEGEPSSGLGLHLCKEFVEKNGGRIRAESIEGRGSTFKFLLPLTEEIGCI